MHHQTLKEVMGRDWWSRGVPLDYKIGLSKTDVMWEHDQPRKEQNSEELQRLEGRA